MARYTLQGININYRHSEDFAKTVLKIRSVFGQYESSFRKHCEANSKI